MRGLRVQVVESLEAFADLAGPWSELVEQCPRPSVFLTHDWYRCWWEAFGERLRPAILCAREGEKLVGAAALGAEAARFRGLPIRRLGFPLNGVTGEADFLVPPWRQDAFDALLEHIVGRGRWHLLELRRMPCDSPHWPWLMEAARRLDLAVTVRPDNRVPIIPIQGDWQGFLATRSSGFRKTIRRRLGRIRHCRQEVRVERLARTPDILAALPGMFRVSANSWKSRRGVALTDQPRAREFYRLLSRRLGDADQVDLWMLHIGSVPVAFEYHLRFAGVSYPIRADFDERYAELSPGAHLEYEILRRLYQDPARCVREYNTCADGYAYELKWTDLIRPQSRLWVFPPTPYGRLLHLLSRVHRPRRGVDEAIDSCRQRSLRRHHRPAAKGVASCQEV